VLLAAMVLAFCLPGFARWLYECGVKNQDAEKLRKRGSGIIGNHPGGEVREGSRVRPCYIGRTKSHIFCPI
jgi:hypothetical protein